MSPLIEVSNDGDQLLILWHGEATMLSSSLLREACRCATCRGDRMRNTFAPDDQVRLLEARPFGVAGLQLVFSDGHSRGLFPWDYLRSLAAGI